MNAIVNRLLLLRDDFMPESLLKQPGLTYSAGGPFTKNKQKIRHLKKSWFQHDMVYGDF